MTRYTRVTFHGKTVDKYTRAALQACERDLGYELTIVQGSYHGGVSASAGTHDGGGVIDLAPYDHKRKVDVLRDNGFAAWYRPAIAGLWAPHIHAVQIGNKKAAPAAKRQIVDYMNGLNGLANHARDTEWRPKVIKAFKYPGVVLAPKHKADPTTPKADDDMPETFNKGFHLKQKLRSKKWDTAKMNSKGDVTVLFGHQATTINGAFWVYLTGLKAGETAYVRAVRVTKRTGLPNRVESYWIGDLKGDGSTVHLNYAMAGLLRASSSSRLRLQVYAPHEGVAIRDWKATLNYWKK